MDSPNTTDIQSPKAASTSTQVASQYQLLRQRRFLPFFLTQFLGAFNDNFFKNALVILISYQLAQSAAQSNLLVNLSAGLFILPYFLFSALAGQLADKYEKSLLIRRIKLAEIVIMLLAAAGLFLNNATLLLGILFLMGMQSSLFGPVKYAYLPQQLDNRELTGGNALVETGTFLAILLGTIGGGLLMTVEYGSAWVSLVIFSIALIGYLISRQIPITPAVEPALIINKNLLSATFELLRYTTGNKVIFQSVLAVSWFWFLGTLYLAQFPNYVKLDIGGHETIVILLLATFSLGIGVGSMLCEKLSGHRVEIGLVPFGAIGITIFGIHLYYAPLPGLVQYAPELFTASQFISSGFGQRIVFDLFMIALFAGFYIVPLYAVIQQRSPVAYRSRIIAANNIINAIFSVAAALLAIILLSLTDIAQAIVNMTAAIGLVTETQAMAWGDLDWSLSISQVFLVTALLNAIVAIYIYSQVPEFLLRFLAWIMIHLIYRVRIQGAEHIPEEGPVMLVCNHVSFIDAIVIGGCIRRPTRFVMYYKIYNLPVLKWIFQWAKTIPIAGRNEDPVMYEQAFAQISEELKQGNVVCIFPEGRLTADGEINEFKSGVEKMLERDPVPVIPMGLRGLWGSIFSRYNGGVMRTYPKFLQRVELCIGHEHAPETSAADLQQAVQQLRGSRP